MAEWLNALLSKSSGPLPVSEVRILPPPPVGKGDFVKKPGVQMIAKIAKALGVSVEDLLK